MLYMWMCTGVLAGFVLCKKQGGTHEHYAALLCNCVRGVNGHTKVNLALQNSTTVTW